MPLLWLLLLVLTLDLPAQELPVPGRQSPPEIVESSVENDLPPSGPQSRNYPYLSTRGQLQVQFDAGSRGAARGDDPVLNGIGRLPGSDQLNIRRGRVVTSLHLAPEVQIVNESNYDTRSNQISVLDFYLRGQITPQLDLRAGLFKIPFGWEGLRSSRGTNTIEMSDVTRGISSFRDSGISLGYLDGPLEATLAVVQGQGGVWTDLNPHKDLVGRLAYRVSPELRLGLSGHLGTTQSEADDQEIPVRRLGLELQYAEEGWKVEAEYLLSQGFNFMSNRDSRAHGYYLALVRQLDPRNDLVLHYDFFDPDLGRVRQDQASNSSNARSRIVLGWNYYFLRSPENRLMINYEFAQEREGPQLVNNGLRVRYQMAW